MERASAAAEAQYVGPPLCNLLLYHSSLCNAIMLCSLVCETSSRLPTQRQRHRTMLTRMAHPLAPTHTARTPSRDAHSCTRCHHTCSSRPNAVAACSLVWNARRTCPPRISVIAPCSFACKLSSRMPISHQRQGAMACWCAKRRRTCPPRISVIVPCPLACGT